MKRHWVYNGQDIVECRVIRPPLQIGRRLLAIIQTAVDGDQEFEIPLAWLHQTVEQAKESSEFKYNKVIRFPDAGTVVEEQLENRSIVVGEHEPQTDDIPRSIVTKYSIRLTKLESLVLPIGSKFLHAESPVNDCLTIFMLVPESSPRKERLEFFLHWPCSSVFEDFEFVNAFNDGNGSKAFLFCRRTGL